MNSAEVPKNPSIYHITSVENVPSIINSGGLSSKNELTKNRTKYCDAAHRNIQDRRARTKVNISCKGNLHDYVPFYFCPRCPMLYAIHKGSVEGFEGTQTSIVHLVSNLDTIDETLIDYCFTDGHATMAFTQFFEQRRDLSKLDWSVITSKDWADTDRDRDRKRRKQAECLIHKVCPWESIIKIGVKNDNVKDRVLDMLDGLDHQPKVVVASNWYYT